MSTLSEIAESVSVRAAEVSRLLREAGLPEPTFNESSAHDFDARQHASANSDALRQARNALVNAAQDLAQITMGPVDYLCSISWSATKIANLGSLMRLEIPQRIPQGGSRKLSDLVVELGLPEITTTRMIRYAVANGIFCEDPVGVIKHTAVSSRLAYDRDVHNYCLLWTMEISSILVQMPEALVRKQLLGDKGPASAMNVAYPDYLDIFDYLSKRTDAAERYATFLTSRAQIPYWSASYLTQAWDWKSIGSEPVVDVGGSAGTTSLTLAQAFPEMHFVSQDISREALKEGEAQAQELGFHSRISFSHHDFFSPQTVSAKAYIIKSIFHDWSHEACVRILKALLPALKNGSHVLVGESLMPDPPALRATAWDYEAQRTEDQFMIAGHGSHERTLEQYQAIFSAASEDFVFNGVQHGEGGTIFSLMDFVYRKGPEHTSCAVNF